MSPPSLSPRPIFDPYAAAPAMVGNAAGWRAVPRVFIGFYRDRLSWLALGVTSAMLCYVGGLIMFWFHAVELEEGGPAISWYSHWLLDSTFAFVALTPALALIMPLAVAWSLAVTGAKQTRAMLVSYAVIAGGLFALATTPGPVAHDMMVGRGTWIAERVTAWIGNPSAQLDPVADYPMSAALTQQLGAGVALYLVLTLLSVLMIRRVIVAAGRRRPTGHLAQATAGGPAHRAGNADAFVGSACDD